MWCRSVPVSHRPRRPSESLCVCVWGGECARAPALDHKDKSPSQRVEAEGAAGRATTSGLLDPTEQAGESDGVR